MKAIRSKKYCAKPLVDELDRFFAREDFDEYVKPYINAGIKFHLVELLKIRTKKSIIGI